MDLDATEEMVQAAAVRLADGIVLRMGGRPADLFHKVNAFTSLGYERAAAGGRLVVAHRQNGADLAAVRFREPVPLSNSRIMRKLLELSDESTPVITDGQCAYGLGTRDSAPDIVGISVRGHAEWELSVNGDVFMRVAYGHAKLPRPLLARDKFDEAAQRTLGSADMDRIWATIEEVRNSEHGTMLVVSNRPEEETNRLGGQALPIRPQRLDPPDVARLGSVDGAVLLGPDGRCHAFGVILDGKAAGHGDPARGSRYNSAVRYQKMKPDTLLVVISDDGTIDLVPDLKPQVHRDAVEAAVQAFCETCETDPVNSEQSTALADHPRLQVAWDALQELYGLYLAEDYDGALAALGRFADLYATGKLPEFSKVVDTVIAWGDEILAWHRCGRPSNGRLEGANNLLQVLRRVAHGFTNPNNYAARGLLLI